MYKADVVNIYTGILLSHKKWNNAIDSNMNGPKDCYTEWSKSDREGLIPYYIAYVWNGKKKYYKITYLQDRNVCMCACV